MNECMNERIGRIEREKAREGKPGGKETENNRKRGALTLNRLISGDQKLSPPMPWLFSARASVEITSPIIPKRETLKLAAVARAQGNEVGQPVLPSARAPQPVLTPWRASLKRRRGTPSREMPGLLLDSIFIFSSAVAALTSAETLSSGEMDGLHQGDERWSAEVQFPGVGAGVGGGLGGSGTGDPEQFTLKMAIAEAPPHFCCRLPEQAIVQLVEDSACAGTDLPQKHCVAYSTPARGICLSWHT